MADSGIPGNMDENSEGVNLLYLAAQKKLHTKHQNNPVGIGADNGDIEATPTLAELAKSAPGNVEAQNRDKSPSPHTDTRMSCKNRIESQKSFAEDNLVGSRCPKVNCTEKIVSEHSDQLCLQHW